MNTPRPIAVVLVTTFSLMLGVSSAYAQFREPAMVSPASAQDAQISGNLPNTRAGAVTMERLTGNPAVTYGALPSLGFEAWFEDQYWRDNFYRVDAFVPLNLDPGSNYFFTHLSGAGTDDGSMIANFGLGYAQYVEGWDRLIRTAAYLDIDGQPASTRTGVSIHSENLGEYIDIRSELGIVLSDNFDIVSDSLTGNYFFQNNNLLLQRLRITETSFNHAQVEVGGPLAFLGQYGFNIYGMAYFLWETDTDMNALGAQVRAEWQITEDVSLNVHVSTDEVFDNNTFLNLIVNTPDGPPQHVAREIPVRERFSKRPYRTGRIPTYRQTTTPNELAINPNTGSAYVIAHIDPDAGAGNGTFESPYGSVAQYQTANGLDQGAFDIIYVRPNRTTAEGVDLQSFGNGLVLFDDQFLLGSTSDHIIPIGLVPQDFLLRALDPGLNAPVLGNSGAGASNIVIASDRNYIAGLTFDGTNSITPANAHVGINGDSDSDPFNGIDGIISNITIANNTFRNNSTGVLIGDLSDGTTTPAAPNAESILIGNTFTNNGVGFDITLDTTNAGPGSTVLTMSILGNTVSNNTIDGGRLTSNGTVAVVDLTGRDLDGDGTIDEVFAFNTFSNNGANGMVLDAHLGGFMAVNVGALPGFAQPPAPAPPVGPFNVFTGNGQAGLLVNATSDDSTSVSSVISGTIIANNFGNPGVGADGLRLIATGDTNTLAFLDFGSTAGNPGQIPVLSGANSLLGLFDGVIDQNNFDRTTSGDDGLVITLTDASGDFNITRNSFVGTNNILAGRGIDASVFANATPNGNVNSQLLMTVGDPVNASLGNLFDGNGDAGIAFQAGGFIGIPPAALDRSFVQISNNVVRNTNGDAILLQREDNSLFTAVVGDGIANNGINGNLLEDNLGAAIQFQSNNGSDQASAIANLSTLVYFDDNVMDSNGEGFSANLFADTTVQVFGVTNVITNTTGSAIRVITSNNSSFGLSAQPTNGEDTNGDGVLQPWEDLNFDGILQGAGPTVLSSVFDSNFIQGFGIDGLWFTANNGSFQDVRVSGTQLSNPLNPLSMIRTVIDGQGASVDGIHIDAFGSQAVFASRPSVWTVQGVDIVDVGNVGLLVNTLNGNNIFNIGGPAIGQNVNISGSGSDGVQVLAAGVASDTFNIDHLQSNNNTGDGANVFQDDLNDIFFNVTNSTFNGNGQTGLTVDNHSQIFGVYNIGNTDRNLDGVISATNEDANNNGLLDAGEDTNGNGILDSGEDVNNDGSTIAGNEFNNNDFQGVFFQTFSDQTGDAFVAGFFDSPDALIPPNPAGTAPQNVQGVNDAGGLDSFYIRRGINELGLYASPGNTSVNVFSRLNFYGNQVLSNGTPLSQADGMVLSVGTNTQMAASVDGNLFGGNSLSDFRTIVVVSQNPLASQNNIAANLDRIRFDPVAFLDLAFGENFAFNPPRAFNVDAPTGPGLGNVGESINIDTLGVNSSVVGRTEVGVFTNSDHVKPEGRNALGFFNIYVNAPGDLDATNNFSQQPGSILAQFLGADISIPVRTTTAGNPIDAPFNTINFINTAFP